MALKRATIRTRKRWTLFSAMAAFGTPLMSPQERSKWRRNSLVQSNGPDGLCFGRFRIPKRMPAEDLMPGGPQYVYETAREAYLHAVKRHHPDTEGGHLETFQAIQSAWDYVKRRYGPGR